MNSYEQVAAHIIKEQESIIGPLALDQARKVSGIQVLSNNDIKIVGDGKDVIEHLVRKYSELFGAASVEVCKEAVKEVNPTISSEDLPEILK